MATRSSSCVGALVDLVRAPPESTRRANWSPRSYCDRVFNPVSFAEYCTSSSRWRGETVTDIVALRHNGSKADTLARSLPEWADARVELEDLGVVQEVELPRSAALYSRQDRLLAARRNVVTSTRGHMPAAGVRDAVVCKSSIPDAQTRPALSARSASPCRGRRPRRTRR